MATQNISNNGSQVVFDSKNETITKRMSVTNNGAWNGEKVDMTVEIDFKGCDLAQIYSWAAQTLIINLQQALRKCDLVFVKELAKSVYKRKATAMGILDDPNRLFNKTMESIKSGDLNPDQVARMIAELQTMLPKKGK